MGRAAKLDHLAPRLVEMAAHTERLQVEELIPAAEVPGPLVVHLQPSGLPAVLAAPAVAVQHLNPPPIPSPAHPFFMIACDVA